MRQLRHILNHRLCKHSLPDKRPAEPADTRPDDELQRYAAIAPVARIKSAAGRLGQQRVLAPWKRPPGRGHGQHKMLQPESARQQPIGPVDQRNKRTRAPPAPTCLALANFCWLNGKPGLVSVSQRTRPRRSKTLIGPAFGLRDWYLLPCCEDPTFLHYALAPCSAKNQPPGPKQSLNNRPLRRQRPASPFRTSKSAECIPPSRQQPSPD